MAMFRAKKLDLGCFVNIRTRPSFRQALRYIVRNTTLPQRARAQAQLQLSQMHAYTRLTQINNRCIEGGKSRGVLRHFRMARASGPSHMSDVVHTTNFQTSIHSG
ncbi:MAG: hypothetical protein Q9196_000339 [Gyalolechia fulgens]